MRHITIPMIRLIGEKALQRHSRPISIWGGIIDFDNIPEDGLRWARFYSRQCRLNDVGPDMMNVNGTWYLIEAYMKYGHKGLNLKGLDLKEVLRNKLLSGELKEGLC